MKLIRLGLSALAVGLTFAAPAVAASTTHVKSGTYDLSLRVPVDWKLMSAKQSGVPARVAFALNKEAGWILIGPAGNGVSLSEVDGAGNGTLHWYDNKSVVCAYETDKVHGERCGAHVNGGVIAVTTISGGKTVAAAVIAVARSISGKIIR